MPWQSLCRGILLLRILIKISYFRNLIEPQDIMSNKFKEYKGLDLPKLGEEVLDFWKEENIFQESISIREGATPFVFFEGPPSANGLPGIHHVMARSIKDIFCRYKTQKGYKVDRKAGWDTHGLPIELGVASLIFYKLKYVSPFFLIIRLTWEDHLR